AIPFMVAALCMALAIIPVGLTRRLAPEPVAPASTGFSLLLNRSRSAFAGALLSGLVAGSFWSLGAVFAQRYTATQMEITLFMSAAIAGGALMQYPIGWLSDRIDRRRVLCFLAIGGLVTSAAVAVGTGQSWFLPVVALFGACVMPLYAISLATAADVSDASEFVAVGTTVLLLNALGAAVAPLLLGQLMTHYAATSLFWSFSLMCGLFALYLARQLRLPRDITVDEQIPFAAAGVDAAPASFGLDPRASDDTPEPAHDADATKTAPTPDNANGGTRPPSATP
ncbi:MAG: MFS transporter, partial [Halioglobus sp.]|nr:MFS transporter [Halioglobus sp.]